MIIAFWSIFNHFLSIFWFENTLCGIEWGAMADLVAFSINSIFNISIIMWMLKIVVNIFIKKKKHTTNIYQKKKRIRADLWQQNTTLQNNNEIEDYLTILQNNAIRQIPEIIILFAYIVIWFSTKNINC